MNLQPISVSGLLSGMILQWKFSERWKFSECLKFDGHVQMEKKKKKSCDIQTEISCNG